MVLVQWFGMVGLIKVPLENKEVNADIYKVKFCFFLVQDFALLVQSRSVVYTFFNSYCRTSVSFLTDLNM